MLGILHSPAAEKKHKKLFDGILIKAFLSLTVTWSYLVCGRLFCLCQFSKRVVCCHSFQDFFLCNYCTLSLVAFPSWLLISGTVPLTFGCWIYDLREVITFHFLFWQFLVFQITWLPAIILWMQAWALPLQVRFFFPSDFDSAAFLADKYSEIIPIYQFLSYSSAECEQVFAPPAETSMHPWEWPRNVTWNNVSKWSPLLSWANTNNTAKWTKLQNILWSLQKAGEICWERSLFLYHGFYLGFSPSLQHSYNPHCNVYLCSIWSSKQPVSKLFFCNPECYSSLCRSATK